MSESAVVHACLQWLAVHGCSVIRNNTGAFKTTYKRKNGTIGTSWIRTGKKGSGDILACSPHGKWIECECKFGDNQQEPHQVLRQQEIEQRHGIYIVARSVDDLEREKHRILGL